MQKLSFKGCCIGSFCSWALKTELVVISTKKCYFCCPATKLLLHYWEEEQKAISLQQCTIHLMQINVKKQIQLSGIYLCNNYVSFNWGKVSWIVLQCPLFLKVIDWHMIEIFILWATSIMSFCCSQYIQLWVAFHNIET